MVSAPLFPVFISNTAATAFFLPVVLGIQAIAILLVAGQVIPRKDSTTSTTTTRPTR